MVSHFASKEIVKCAILIVTLAWFTPGLSTNQSTEQKRIAESEHTELQKKLSELKHDISNTESAKQRAEDALSRSEMAIANTNRKLAELTKTQQEAEERLAQLIQQQQQLQQQVEQQKKQFSTLLRQQYETGNTDRIKLILSGDDPNRINRDLHYLGYLSQSQNTLITQLRDNLSAVETNKQAAEQTKQELDNIASEQQQHKSDLVNEKAKRANLIKQLSSKLTTQRKEAGQLQKNERRLANLVERLNQRIAEQRKAAQIQQEKQRAALLAQKEKRKTAQNASAPTQITKIDSEIDSDSKQFSQLKRHLPPPAKGELIAKYGSPRGEGAVWKGILIHANEGDKIKSIAPGKVIFAEWLRGFGNLIILDHGAQYMSIYGNNQSLLKQVGDKVNTGDIIATVGNNGSNEQSGLYFELRFKGRAIDPLQWININ